VEVAGANLQEVMARLQHDYPGLKESLGKMDFVSVFVNGERVKAAPEQWTEVAVQDVDEVTLILPIAGGNNR